MDTQKIFHKYSRVIGVDESGKGDYFGPLVAAAVLIKKEDLDLVAGWGVRDSKTLSEKQIIEKARQIKEKLMYNVVVINPKKYNELYSKFKNLNRLLAWAHARVIENILESHKADVAISDQFGYLPYVEKALMEEGKKIDFISETKAERFLPVACASIVARFTFINALQRLSDEVGFVLSKGGNNSTIIDGKKLISAQLKLEDYAKVHFKNTKEIIEG